MSVRTLIAIAISLVLTSVAVAGPRKPRIVYIHTETASLENAQDVVNKLTASGRFAAVETFNANLATPTLEQLKVYDAALVANRYGWFSRAALGNVLADYVDAGFGVVLAPFTNTGAANTNLAGRWSGAYNGILFSNYITGTATLGTIALGDYLPSTGVQTFNGGALSNRPSGTALQSGCTAAFFWSDGKPLSTVGPLPNRADIGFYPTSSDVNPGYWNAATDGVQIMVNALTWTIRPKVLICAAAAIEGTGGLTNPRFTDPKNKLGGTQLFSVVNLYDAALGTPTLAELQQYDIVFTWSNVGYKDPVALGNVLADYTDWGGGVVAALFATSNSETTPDARLGGRWQSGGYPLIDNTGTVTSGTQATLGTVSYPNHPAMDQVATFDGGSISFRPTSTALPSNTVLVARWSDGKPLIVTSTTRHNRCDLGMYPPSSFVVPGFWAESTNGTRIMANALMYTARPYVGILHSETTIPTASIRSRLALQRRFSAVDTLPALQSQTPTLDALRPYNSLLIWGDNDFANAPAVGNVLADYVDGGGGVVVGLYSNAANPATLNNRPKGRWISQGYDITPESALTPSVSGTNATLGSNLAPSHPVTNFVRKLDGGIGSIRQGSNPDLRGRRLLQWSDGKMLASVHNFRRRVDVGLFPPSQVEYFPGWVVRTDGAVLLSNSLDYVSAMKPCPGDFNGDAFVDDVDFVLFADFYQAFVEPRGDLTGDGLTDDPDFVIFAGNYDSLSCP